jgi:hypothetical protein
VLSAGFLEARARVLEIAAFLDRIDRAPESASARDDFRYRALHAAIAELKSSGRRTVAVHMCFSDPTSEPIAVAGSKGAVGAWPGERR